MKISFLILTILVNCRVDLIDGRSIHPTFDSKLFVLQRDTHETPEGAHEIHQDGSTITKDSFPISPAVSPDNADDKIRSTREKRFLVDLFGGHGHHHHGHHGGYGGYGGHHGGHGHHHHDYHHHHHDYHHHY